MNPNLELDLISNQKINEKCKYSPLYANDLYSSLCNNRFFYGESEWTCSWRHAGSIVAEIVGEGDYLTYYCNGNEGFVTDEIRLDLMMMGWVVGDQDEYMNEVRKLLKESKNEKENCQKEKVI